MLHASSCRLDVIGLGKNYPGGTRALDGIDLTAGNGEILALLGPSGCGKTSLLMAIAGLLAPDRGEIRLDGACVLAVPPEHRRIAVVFQNHALFPHLMVRDNVAFGLRMRGVPRRERAARVAEALRLVHVEDLAERHPDQLSGGQSQRVALARALVTEPRLLLLDEPFGALDQALREEMQTELRKLQRRLGITTVMVTHDQREALVMADRIAVLRAGRIEQIGAPGEIYDHPRTRHVAMFTGVENVLPVRVSEGGVELAGTRLEGITGPRDGAAWLALRAEDLGLESARAESSGALRGVVGSARMRGADLRYEVELADGTRMVATRMRRGGTLLAPGTPVSLRFPTEQCTLLEG